jgi:pyrroloquinoline quinone (PQQ) biosynthesis protein C
MRPMILHDLSEVNHGEMALKDFVRLGGDERWARSRRITPEAFAMAATCRMLAERESPFCYLGFMYLFEALTPILTERAQHFLTAHGFPVTARHFIDVHATEDVAHASMLADLVDRIASEYPDQAGAIEYGFDCFSSVYPLPIWNAALRHAREQATAPVLA